MSSPYLRYPICKSSYLQVLLSSRRALSPFDVADRRDGRAVCKSRSDGSMGCHWVYTFSNFLRRLTIYRDDPFGIHAVWLAQSNRIKYRATIRTSTNTNRQTAITFPIEQNGIRLVH